jgi:hypothetical protein
LAFAELGQPEVGMRVVCRPGIQIEIELEGNMHRLKLCVASVDRGNEDPPNPICAISKRGGGVVRSRSVCRFRALAGPLASIHKGIA